MTLIEGYIQFLENFKEKIYPNLDRSIQIKYDLYGFDKLYWTEQDMFIQINKEEFKITEAFKL